MRSLRERDYLLDELDDEEPTVGPPAVQAAGGASMAAGGSGTPLRLRTSPMTAPPDTTPKIVRTPTPELAMKIGETSLSRFFDRATAGVERSGGILPAISDVGVGVQRNAEDMYNGISALMAVAKDEGVTLTVGGASRLARFVTGGTWPWLNPQAEERASTFHRRLGETVIAGIAQIREDVLHFGADPVGYLQERPLYTVLDIGAAMSGGGKVVGEVFRRVARPLARGAGATARAVSVGQTGFDVVEAAARGFEAAGKTAELAGQFTPVRMGVRGAGAVLKGARKVVPALDRELIKRSLYRDVDTMFSDYRRMGRVFDTQEWKDATDVFGKLTADEKLAMIPVLTGRASAVEASDEFLDAVRKWQQIHQSAPYLYNFYVKLNLLTPMELEDAPWKELGHLTGKSKVELMNDMVFADPEAAMFASRWRERRMPIPESELPLIKRTPRREVDVYETTMPEFEYGAGYTRPPGPRGELQGDAAIKSELAWTRRIDALERTPPVQQEMRYTPGAARPGGASEVGSIGIRETPGAVEYTPGAARPGGPSEVGSIEIPKEYVGTRRRDVVSSERAAVTGRVPSGGGMAPGEVRWGKRIVEGYFMDGQLPDLGAPKVLYVKPTYMPILQERALAQTKLGGGWRRMRQQVSEVKEGTIDLGDEAVGMEFAKTTPESIKEMVSELGEAPRLRAEQSTHITGDITPSGNFREAWMLKNRTGKNTISPSRINDPEVVAAAYFHERSRFLRSLNLVNELIENYAFRITPAEGGFKVIRPTGHAYFDSVFASAKDAKTALQDVGIEWQGRRIAGALLTPAHLEASLAMSDRVMGEMRVGLLHKKTLTEAITDALKTIDTPAMKRITEDAAKKEIYVIPKDVADRIRKTADVERFGKENLGILDDGANFSRNVLLATPRFLINNLSGNVVMAALAGVTPRSLIQAVQPRYRKLLEDIPELTIGQTSQESSLLGKVAGPSGPVTAGGMTSDSILRMPTRATMSSVENATNFIRQTAVLEAMGAEGAGILTAIHGFAGGLEMLGRRVHSWGEATDNYFRRAAAIQASKNLLPDEKLREVVRLQQVGIDGMLMDDMVTNTMKRLEIVRSNPEVLADVVKNVNYWFFDYFATPLYQRVFVRKMFPFWNWTRGITRLHAVLPVDHPGRAMLAAHIAQVSSDLTEQEELPKAYKGTVEAHFQEGSRVRGTGMNPFGSSLLWGREAASGQLMSNPVIDAAITFGGYMASMGVEDSPSDPNKYIKSYNRVYRMDRFQGEYVVEEASGDSPSVPQYFLRLIPHMAPAAEAMRNILSRLPDSAVKEWGARTFGKPSTRSTQTWAGSQPPHDQWRRTKGFMGLSITRDLPSNWKQARKIGEAEAMDMVQKYRYRRMLEGQPEEYPPIAP